MKNMKENNSTNSTKSDKDSKNVTTSLNNSKFEESSELIDSASYDHSFEKSEIIESLTDSTDSFRNYLFEVETSIDSMYKKNGTVELIRKYMKSIQNT